MTEQDNQTQPTALFFENISTTRILETLENSRKIPTISDEDKEKFQKFGYDTFSALKHKHEHGENGGYAHLKSIIETECRKFDGDYSLVLSPDEMMSLSQNNTAGTSLVNSFTSGLEQVIKGIKQECRDDIPGDVDITKSVTFGEMVFKLRFKDYFISDKDNKFEMNISINSYTKNGRKSSDNVIFTYESSDSYRTEVKPRSWKDIINFKPVQKFEVQDVKTKIGIYNVGASENRLSSKLTVDLVPDVEFDYLRDGVSHLVHNIENPFMGHILDILKVTKYQFDSKIDERKSSLDRFRNSFK